MLSELYETMRRIEKETEGLVNIRLSPMSEALLVEIYWRQANSLFSHALPLYDIEDLKDADTEKFLIASVIHKAKRYITQLTQMTEG